jgi:hypothetical protein
MVNEFDLGLGLIQLVALMLPVLIILLDVIVNIRNGHGDPLDWPEFLWARRSVYLIVVAGLLLVGYFLSLLVTIDVLQSLPVTNELFIIFSLVSILVSFLFLLRATIGVE